MFFLTVHFLVNFSLSPSKRGAGSHAGSPISKYVSPDLTQVEPRIRPVRAVLKPGKGAGSCSACGAEARDGRDALRAELERLKDQLASTRETILRMHEREERVKQRSVSSILLTLRVNYHAEPNITVFFMSVKCCKKSIQKYTVISTFLAHAVDKNSYC
jgi:hypothetical protein